MTDTIISSATREVVIGFDRPFVMIGERINPTGRKLLAAEMKESVESDALVMPSSSGSAIAGSFPASIIRRLVSSNTTFSTCSATRKSVSPTSRDFAT